MQAKTGILLTDDEYTQILNVIADKTKHRTDSVVAKILNDHNLFGFIYGGHTGEEVFLAVYDPRPGQRMTGHHSNIELNHYLRESLDLGSTLEDLTKSCFAKHTAVFNSKECTINKEDNQPVLTVKHKKKVLEIPAYTNIVKFNGKEIPLNSVIVYVDQNDTFYLPQSLAALLE
jgi:alkaline phosphatase